jgi:hypothetical protein
MAAAQTFTGRQGAAQVNSNTIPIHKWSGGITRAYADSTDSSTYNPATGQTWETQAPGTVVAEGTLEGYFDLATTDADIVQLFSSDGPYPVTLSLTRSQDFFRGNANFMNFKANVSVPGATMVDWTCDWKSSGVPSYIY